MRAFSLIRFFLIIGIYAGNVGAEMPPDLTDAARRAGLPSGDLGSVNKKPVVWLVPPGKNSRQFTLAGLVKLDAAANTVMNDLLGRTGLLTIEGLQQAGSFSVPPVLADVAAYQLPDSDIDALTSCEIGECKMKLRAQGVEAIEQVDWSAEDVRERVNRIARQSMVDYVRTYLEGGEKALGSYVDKPKPLGIADGVEELVTAWQTEESVFPEIWQYLLSFPNATLSGARDRLLWAVDDYGYRPVTSLVHALFYQPNEGSPPNLVVLKNIYASHYFHARMQLIGSFEHTEDPGVSYVGYVDLMLFDDDIGHIKRRMLRSGLVKGVRKRLATVQAGY